MSEPDIYIQRELPKDRKKLHALQKESAAELRDRGMTWLRWTLHEDHDVLIVEGWKIRPKIEAPHKFYVQALAND